MQNKEVGMAKWGKRRTHVQKEFNKCNNLMDVTIVYQTKSVWYTISNLHAV